MEIRFEPRETERLEALSRYEILDSPPEPVFDDLTALAADVCEVPISLITFLDGNREWFKSSVGLPWREVPRKNAFCAQTMMQSDVLVVPDATRDIRFAQNPLVTGEPHIRFYAGYPLLSADGHGLGALCVLDQVPHKLEEKQVQFLRRLGHEVTMLLELRREVRERRHQNEQQAAELSLLQERLIAETEHHRKAEEDLLRRERQLADAQRLAKLGSWEWDLQADNVAWSDELYRIFGLKPNQFRATYEDYLQRIHPDDRSRVDALIKSSLATGQSFAHEKRVVLPDGRTRIVHGSGEVVYDEKRHPVRMVGYAQDITEQRELENQLEGSLSLSHSILESTADGILTINSNGKLVGYNQRFLELWRLSPGVIPSYEDKAVLQSVLSQLKDPDSFLAKVEELYGNPEQESMDVLYFKDGRVYERYSRPQRSGAQVTGRVFSFRDVTEHYQTTQVLKQSEERYRSLVIASAQIVWTTDAEGRAVTESPTWLNFTGQGTEEMLGFGWLNVVHPEDRERVAVSWSHSVATRTLYELEFSLRHVSGGWRRVLTRGVPIFEADGTVREWIGSCLDITERKRTEQRLVDEHDFSETLINSLPGIFYLLDQNGSIVRWNKNLETVTGYSPAEIKAMNATDFLPPEEKHLIAESYQKVVAYGENASEVTLLTKTGERLPYYGTGRLTHVCGKPCLLGVAIDISERKHAEEEVRKLNQQLETRVKERTRQLDSSNQELRSFSYTVSHDLKAPLRAITGFSEAIKEDCELSLDEEHKAYLARIIQSAGRMSRLIDDLLTYSRLGRASVQLRPVQTDQLIRKVTEDFTLQIKRTGGTLTVAPDLPVVNADPSLLTQVFSNLIENAINYRKPEVPLEVRIAWKEKGADAILCVEDNGIGIEASHHERIFEVFQRLHSEEKYPGTGIGLANVKKAVEMQGGHVWVESQMGRGSSFCVQLRRASLPEKSGSPTL